MAGDDRSAAWVDGEIADRWPRPPRLRGLLIALLALSLAIDLVIGLLLARAGEVAAPPESRIAVRERLAAAAADGDNAYLLVGDSVLAGDVLATQLDDWGERRVLDYLRREEAPQSPARFHQVALDGLLPVDVDRIVDELDAIDPEGEVHLVLELNLRYFSPHYADQRECSRAWLCKLGSASPGDDLPTLTELAAAPIRDLGDALTPRLPLVRHRQRLGLDRRISDLAPPLATLQPAVAEERRHSEEESRARLLEHYRESDLGDSSEQVAALERVLQRLARRGRSATLFTTPLSRRALGEAVDDNTIGARYAALSERVRRVDPQGQQIRLVELDHPLFADEHFIDHCHLLPEGNRLLSLNLLHELNLELARRPGATEVIRSEGPHTTLIAQLPRGYAEGAAWQALFRDPAGIVWDPAGHQLVIADSGNHVLRRLGGSLQTTELLAGTPTVAGDRDGPAASALLSRPRHPCVIDGQVFFIDGRSASLRSVDDGLVTTWKTFPRHLRALRCHDGAVFGLSAESKLHVLNPETAQQRTYTLERPDDPEKTPELKTLALGPGRTIYAVSADDQILRGVLGEAASVATELIFANDAEEVLPTARMKKFPYPFDQARFASIQDLVYVERYGGLLVQDDVPAAKPSKDLRNLTERIHLRYLDLDQRKIYPWIKPEVFGQAYAMWNANSDSPVSGVHLGSMSLDQATASLFYLERRRSRLYRIDDGLLGLAKTGHFGGGTAETSLHDRIGAEMGRIVLGRFQPQRRLGQSWADQPRRGPFVGLFIGSSMASYNDLVGEYSLGRKLEQALAAELGYRDRIRFDLFQRTKSAASLPEIIEHLMIYEEAELRADVVFLEIGLLDRFAGDSLKEEALLSQLRQLETFRRETGALVLFLDNTAMGTRYVDSMRAKPPWGARILRQIERAGFRVVNPGDRIVQRNLDYSVWGNPPWSREKYMHHGSPWAIELTGELFSELVYPQLREHLRTHTPRHSVEPVALGPGAAPAPDLLVGALSGGTIARSDLPAIEPETIQIRYADGHLRLFLDQRSLDPAASSRANALAAIYSVLLDDVYGGLAERVSVEIAAFDSYDEYGAGSMASAKTLWRRSLDREGLARMLADSL